MALLPYVVPRRQHAATDVRGTSPEPGTYGEKPVASWDTSLGSAPCFVDITDATGISFCHENGHTGRYHYPEVMGAGVGLLDYNNDGYLDIYFVNGNHLLPAPSPDITNHLYRNNGDGTFTDVTERAGVGDATFGQGCCVGDYDNDGDADLFVSNCGPNVLYRNNGNGTFTDVTKAAGVEDQHWGQTCSFLDYDGDGWLDLYVQNYLTYSISRERQAYVWIGDHKVVDYPGPSEYAGSADRLYRNNGDGTFTDRTEAAGMLYPSGKGMGCACVDLDDDGDPEIFVTNDGMENYFFKNRGDGTFEEIGLTAGVAFSGVGSAESSMGVDVGDADLDGRLDLIVPCLWQQVFTLYRNEKDCFVDISWRSGLAQGTSRVTGFSPNFIDYDNDGDLDLFFSTGGVRMSDLAIYDASYMARYGLKNLLLANDGTGRYTNVSSWAGPHFQEMLISRGSATGDIDNDGDIDLVINNLSGRAVILRNDTPSGHWITLTVLPRRGNRDGLGTSVWIEAGGMRQRAVIHGAVTYLSQIDRRVHFGLGRAEKIDRLEILWPDREREIFENLAVDRILPIEQGAKEVE